MDNMHINFGVILFLFFVIRLLLIKYSERFKKILKITKKNELVKQGDFLDLDFLIKDQKQIGSDFINVYALGYWKNKQVNVWVDNIPLKAEPFVAIVDGKYQGNQNAYKGRVYISFEQPLVELYAHYCGENIIKNIKGKKKIEATLMALAPWQIELNGGELRFKLFFEENNLNYAELFLNFNIKENKIEIHEKDLDYRKNILKILNNETLIPGSKNKQDYIEVGFSKTSEMLDEVLFWQIVDKSREVSSSQEEQGSVLIEEIQKLTPKQIVGFHLRTNNLLYNTYNSEMWCAGFVMNGGCSDDSFEYFRCWVISKGKDVYYNAKQNPDSLFNVANLEMGDYDFETFRYLALEAFKNKTDKDLYEYIDEENLKTKEGQYPQFEFTWKEEDILSIEKICPKLYSKFMGY